MLRSQTLQRSSLIIRQGLIIALFIAASIPAISQQQHYAMGLYQGHKTIIKATVHSVIKSTVSKNTSVSQSNPLTTGTWTALTAPSQHGNSGICLLLSDGRVLCHTGDVNTGDIYDILTPDVHGSYINGTWSVSAESQRWRYAFSSDVLKDGRVYVGGGEYGTDGTQNGSHAEVYDPVTNTWAAETTPGQVISDGNSEILPDGRVLQALLYDFGDLKHTAIFDPVTNTWSGGPDSHGVHNESMWLKLPDNSILMVDMQRLDDSYTFTTPPHTERYIPASNSWVVDADVPVDLYDPYGYETGPAFLLPDGRAFFMGSSGHTAYYTPSGTVSPGTWAAGPDMPNGTGMPDAPGAMMINGKILFACSPAPSSGNNAPTPTYWYEFDYLTNTYTQINAPQGGLSYNDWSQHNTLLDLPDGSVLAAIYGSTTYYVYTPNGSPLATGKPTISNITLTGSNTYGVNGTGFNGISEGSAFGDENQNASNYPLVRLTSGSNVYYCRTYNWNSTGVQRGNAADSVTFSLPAGLSDGSYSLVVVANGIASDPMSFATGCQPPTNLTALSLTSTSAVLSWDVPGGSSVASYKLSYKVGTASTFTTVTVHNLPYTLTGLTANTGYKYKVQSVCDGNAKSDYSLLSSFKTLHNGEVSYCTISGSTGYEFINQVSIRSIKNTSGDNSGYGDYSALSTNLAIGSSQSIKLVPGFYEGAYKEYWEVYIDYNHNGWFGDAGEKVATGHRSTALTATFTVPLSATIGSTRMRVVMHFNSFLKSTCGNFSDGEVEDYTVNITGAGVVGATSQASAVSSILVVPNPVKSYSATAVLNLTKQGNTSLSITDLTGRVLFKTDVTDLHVGKNTVALNGLSKLTNGVFMIVATQNGVIVGRGQVEVSR